MVAAVGVRGGAPVARTSAWRSAGVSPGTTKPLASISAPAMGISWPAVSSTRKAPRSFSMNTCVAVASVTKPRTRIRYGARAGVR